MQPGDDDVLGTVGLFDVNEPDPNAGNGGEVDPNAKPDPWEAVHELRNQMGTLVTAVTKLTEAQKPAEPQRAIAGVQDAGPMGGGDDNPVLLAFKAGMSSGRIKTQADAAKFFDEQQILNPGWTTMAQIHLSQAAAASAANVVGGQGRAQAAHAALDTFRREHLTDPMFLAVREDFEALIERERQLGSFEKLSFEQVQQGLESVYDVAVGKAARKRAKGSSADDRLNRSNRPPLYPVGSGGGFGGERNPGKGRVQLDPQNEVEREIVESGRAYKLSDEDIADSLRQYREDVG